MSASRDLDFAGRPRSPDRAWRRYRPSLSWQTVALHRRHVALSAFVAGLVLGPRAPGAAVALAAALLLGAPRRRAVLALAAAALCAGAVVATERLRVLDRTALAPAQSFTARGFVLEPPRRRSFGVVVAPVRLMAGRGTGERVLLRAPSRLRWAGAEVGDEVVASGRLRALGPYERHERVRGTHAVLEAEAIRPTGRRRASVFDALRRRAERALDAGLGREQAALARGMVLGQDQALSDDLRDAFRISGLAHLLAASGSNVMLLASLVLALAASVGVMLRGRLTLALLAVAAYVPVAGAGPSIQRAGIMGAAGLVAGLASRPASRWYAVLLAAALTLALNPRAAEDVGWQLSFAAVIAILALHRRLTLGLVSRHCPRPLAEALALTIAATAGTAPLMALQFGEVSLVSLPANLLAAPAIAPVMWLGTVAGVAGGPLALALDGLAAFPLAYLAWLARGAASMPAATVSVSLGGWPAALGAYAVLAAAAVGPRRLGRLLTGRKANARRPRPRHPLLAPAALVAVVLAVAAAGALARPEPPSRFTVSALAVGQGDAILVQHGEHAVLFDTGPPGAPVVERLREQGVRRLDAVVVTHSSSDHEGGLGAVLAGFPVGLVVDGRQTAEEERAMEAGEAGAARFAGVPAAIPRAVPAAGQVLRAGPMSIEVLWPPPGADRTGDPNLTATVALVRDGGRTALLTADAESDVTLALDLPDVDVLKVAHHGSRDETLPALLAEVRPEHALISVGRNTYGHPAPETLEALRAVPDVRRTDRGGTVSVTLG